MTEEVEKARRIHKRAREQYRTSILTYVLASVVRVILQSARIDQLLYVLYFRLCDVQWGLRPAKTLNSALSD
jgi:hypothetical protein